MYHSMLPLIILCTRSRNFAWHILWCSTTESKNLVKLLAISQTIHTVCGEDDLFSKGKFTLLNSLFHSLYFVFPKRSFSFADLFAVRYLWVVRKEDKCCVVTQRTADIFVAWLVYFACLRSHVLRAYCNFESKQANSITLFGRRPNNKPYIRFSRGHALSLETICPTLKNFIYLRKHERGKFLTYAQS